MLSLACEPCGRRWSSAAERKAVRARKQRRAETKVGMRQRYNKKTKTSEKGVENPDIRGMFEKTKGKEYSRPGAQGGQVPRSSDSDE